MQKIFTPFLSAICLIGIAHGAMAQVNFTDSNLPIIVINTNSQAILDDPKITCNMGIIYNGTGVRNYLTDPFNNYNGKIAIEIRGSTSQQYPKKSYGLETRDSLGNKLNVSLLGLPPEHDWILYGAYPDKSLMRNEIAYYLFSKMQLWSPRTVYCELVIDGQYMGLYTLTEKIKRDPNRVDIANLLPTDTAGDELTGGYIIKVDKTTGNSNTTWTSPYQNKVKFLYHDPEDVELQPVQRNYIRTFVTNFENAVYGPNFMDPLVGFRKYIDLYSFIDFFLMQELGRTVDGYRSSSFMYKDKNSKDSLLHCGPMWDFNLSFGNADYCDAYDTTGWQYNFANVCPSFTTEPPDWWARLLQDPAYRQQMRCRWDNLRRAILHTDSINAWIDSTAAWLSESQQRNFTQWPILGVYVNWNYFVGLSYQEEVDYLKWWFRARSEWMDNNLPGVCPNVSTGPNVNTGLVITAYPNPLDEFTKLVVRGGSGKEKQVTVTDIAGKKILSGSIPAGEEEFLIGAAGWNAGMYIYCVSESGTVIGTGKLIAE